MVARQGMSEAPESTTVVVLHVSLSQEVSLEESYLELVLVEQHLLKHFQKLRKIRLRKHTINQALFLNQAQMF